MRKYYIDNIRWLCILLLFPYHTFMIYNSFGEDFYVKGPDLWGASGLIVATGPWFMPLLFVLAGIGSAYALQKRTPAQYVKERVGKLLVPLVVGLLLLVPVQTYFAERFHNGYTGGYFQQYILFFTKPTDLSGNTGGFTPAHLWFIFYLFLISLVALPLMVVVQNAKKKLPVGKMPLGAVWMLFVLPFLMTPILDIGGKSFGEFFAYFFLGYLVLSAEEILEKLDRYRFLLLAVGVALMAATLLVWYFWWFDIWKTPSLVYDILVRVYGWAAILAVLGLGRHSLNFSNKLTQYVTAAAYPVYIFHQNWLITVAYVVFLYVSNTLAQILLIMTGSLLLTFGTYEVFRRIPGWRVLFGIRLPVKKRLPHALNAWDENASQKN